MKYIFLILFCLFFCQPSFATKNSNPLPNCNTLLEPGVPEYLHKKPLLFWEKIQIRAKKWATKHPGEAAQDFSVPEFGTIVTWMVQRLESLQSQNLHSEKRAALEKLLPELQQLVAQKQYPYRQTITAAQVFSHLITFPYLPMRLTPENRNELLKLISLAPRRILIPTNADGGEISRAAFVWTRGIPIYFLGVSDTPWKIAAVFQRFTAGEFFDHDIGHTVQLVKADQAEFDDADENSFRQKVQSSHAEALRYKEAVLKIEDSFVRETVINLSFSAVHEPGRVLTGASFDQALRWEPYSHESCRGTYKNPGQLLTTNLLEFNSLYINLLRAKKIPLLEGTKETYHVIQSAVDWIIEYWSLLRR